MYHNALTDLVGTLSGHTFTVGAVSFESNVTSARVASLRVSTAGISMTVVEIGVQALIDVCNERNYITDIRSPLQGV